MCNHHRANTAVTVACWGCCASYQPPTHTPGLPQCQHQRQNNTTLTATCDAQRWPYATAMTTSFTTPLQRAAITMLQGKHAQHQNHKSGVKSQPTGQKCVAPQLLKKYSSSSLLPVLPAGSPHNKAADLPRYRLGHHQTNPVTRKSLEPGPDTAPKTDTPRHGTAAQKRLLKDHPTYAAWRIPNLSTAWDFQGPVVSKSLSCPRQTQSVGWVSRAHATHNSSCRQVITTAADDVGGRRRRKKKYYCNDCTNLASATLSHTLSYPLTHPRTHVPAGWHSSRGRGWAPAWRWVLPRTRVP